MDHHTIRRIRDAALQRRREAYRHPTYDDAYDRRRRMYYQRLEYLRRHADRLVFEMSDDFVALFGIETASRRLMIAVKQLEKIRSRRRAGGEADQELASDRLVEAANNATHVGSHPSRVLHFDLICQVPSVGRTVCLCIKFVPKASSKRKVDEWWVATAMPLGRKNADKRIRQHNLRPLHA